MTAKVDVTVRIVRAVAEVIRELGEVPSGHLYARLMGVLSLDQYQQVVSVLVRAGLVRSQHDCLTWIGGAS